MAGSVILIGMPGCGKSTCGVLAAKALCKSFLDTDILIQERTGMPLQEIIETKGTDFFAETEEAVLSDLAAYTNTVIATGGSAVYYDNAMRHLKSIGRVVYLKVGFEEMMCRIKNIKTRGILLAPGETMEDLVRRRTVLYEKYADDVIDCDGTDVEEVVSAICRTCI